MWRISLGLVLLLLCRPLAADAGDAERTVLAFFERWGAGDVAAAGRHWVSPAAPGFYLQVRRAHATRCITLHEARILSVKPAGGDAVEVETELRLTRRNAMPGALVYHEIAVAILRLRPVDGVWKIESWTAREEREVDALLRETANRSEWLDQRMPSWSPALARVLAARAVTLTNRDELLLAREVIGYADRVATALGDDGGLSAARGAASALERKELRPDHARSLALARESLVLAERSGDPNLIALALTRVGRSLVHTPNADRAPFERVLGMADFVEDETVLSTAASQLSLLYDVAGDARAALLNAALAERYGRAAGSAVAMLSAELNFAGSYHHIGDLELAALHYERAGRLATANGFHRIYASFLNQLVFIGQALGHPLHELLALIDAGLALPGVRSTPHLAVDLYSARSAVNMDLGDFAQAEADLAEALTYDHAVPGVYGFLAVARLRQGRHASAMDAVALAETAPQGRYVYIEALRSLGRIDAAIDAARCAIEETRAMLAKMAPDARHRQSMVASRYGLDQTLVELLVQRGEPEEALAAAEAAKAQVLLDVSANSGTDGGAPDDDAEHRLAEEIERLNRAVLAEKNAAKLDALRTELARVRPELGDVRTRNAARAATSPTAQASARGGVEWRLPGVAALEYMVGERRTVIFAIRSGTSGRPRLDVRVVEVPREELASVVRQLRERVAARDLRYHEPARRLYELLLAPVASILPEAATLCIIPDSDLWTLLSGQKLNRFNWLVESVAYAAESEGVSA